MKPPVLTGICILFYKNKRIEDYWVRDIDAQKLQAILHELKGRRIYGLVDESEWKPYHEIFHQYCIRYRNIRRKIIHHYDRFLDKYCPNIQKHLEAACLTSSQDEFLQHLENVHSITKHALYSFKYWLSWWFDKETKFDDGTIELYVPERMRTTTLPTVIS